MLDLGRTLGAYEGGRLDLDSDTPVQLLRLSKSETEEPNDDVVDLCREQMLVEGDWPEDEQEAGLEDHPIGYETKMPSKLGFTRWKDRTREDELQSEGFEKPLFDDEGQLFPLRDCDSSVVMGIDVEPFQDNGLTHVFYRQCSFFMTFTSATSSNNLDPIILDDAAQEAELFAHMSSSKPICHRDTSMQWRVPNRVIFSMRGILVFYSSTDRRHFHPTRKKVDL
ncbi:hypothetical protein D9758_004797 [Tetrapyrgos nigripes]|uniref:Uncharacterized protein n=1 Tax=Tetrapyrgos nigripes TaxID=182062 RepID=A0A8H5LJ67_9AGAR|nr:hypothetical protein D9758_004797 [Tetrapyrgos nigripes]